MQITPAPTQTPAQTPDRPHELMVQARALETAFLSEMLGQAGLGTTSADFGGGPGEEQFGSFLRQEQARLMVEKGGIGLAEIIFNSLSARDK